MMDTLQDALARCGADSVALGHFNVPDAVFLKAIVTAAEEVKVPILVAASEGERAFIGTRQPVALVRSVRDESNVSVFLSADHTHSLPKAVEAATPGCDPGGLN